ncbi:MAG: ABC transporter ATP-binding protein [Alphaproteobacteria bacterium]|nr:ABC transporter ATP-binding protein [Alphaproteobacteria bacterium]
MNAIPDNALISALEIKGVYHKFSGVAALAGFDLSIKRGEVVSLLGPSGCGKTTALRIAAGLETLQQGEVFLNGRVIANASGSTPPERRNVGFLFQDYALFPHLTVAKNIAFGLKGSDVASVGKRVSEVLDSVEMSAFAKRFPHELSGGQQQRIALARALAPNPGLVLLDEPFSGLDARMRDKIRDETLHILKATGAATLMVTHDAEEAMFMSDKIVVMSAGKAVQTGTPVSLYCEPKTAFVAEIFGEVNRLSGVVNNGSVLTPVGEIQAPDLRDGESVQVLIRPEALRLSASGDDAEGHFSATVLAARMLGRTSLIHLCLHQENGQDVHLHSRMPGRFLPPENTTLSIALDRSQAFVFSD